MSVSVVMAVYNGDAYLKEQIESIVCQLTQEDELIISLDPSSDNSKTVIESYQKTYPFITLLEGPGKGLIRNFENGLKHVHNEYVFLSDQDDVWKKNKVETVLNAFDENTMLVMHDAVITDSDLNEVSPSFFKERNVCTGYYHNLLKNSYRGCCMAFRKEVLNYVLPFPTLLPMHDQYIALTAELMGDVKLIEEPLMKYRRHEENASSMEHAGIIQMIKWRVQIIKAMHSIRKRLK